MESSTVHPPAWPCPPRLRWARAVSAASSRPAPARPLVVSSDEELLDDLLRLLAAAGTEPELATGGPSLRRAHRAAPLVLVGADALAGGVLRALPRRPGVVVVSGREFPADQWAAAVEVGAERVAQLPEDEAWLLSRAAAAVRGQVERGRLVAVGGGCGGGGASTVARAGALPAGRGVVRVGADPWGAGRDLLLGAEHADGLRWPELAGLRGRVAGDALVSALPEIADVHVVAASRETPFAVPEEALTAVVDAARAIGRPVIVALPRPGPAGNCPPAVLADADLAVLVVPARLRAATAARLLVDGPGAPWAAAHLGVRGGPGGFSSEEGGDVVVRPALAELPCDRCAVRRGERGEPPAVSPRSPLGTVARRILSAAGQEAAHR